MAGWTLCDKKLYPYCYDKPNEKNHACKQCGFYTCYNSNLKKQTIDEDDDIIIK